MYIKKRELNSILIDNFKTKESIKINQLEIERLEEQTFELSEENDRMRLRNKPNVLLELRELSLNNYYVDTLDIENSKKIILGLLKVK